ncbi:MAG: heparan-alpha-glucosaminide N-acetyltransferase domain-containing protein, partial [FCB group bacterium]
MSEAVLQPKKERLVFIDIMRGLAVIWMIETHVVDICLNGIYKNGFFYDILNISNGFVAVAFIFCAGAGFWLASMRKGDDYKKFKPSLWAYLRRLGFILLIGYWLHVPALSLQKVLSLQPSQFMVFYECDVLHNIVISSLIALLVLMLSPKLKYMPYIFTVLALTFFFLAPYIWSLNPMSSMPSLIGAYFSKPPISKFPLFHWSGYFFAGAAITSFFMNAKDKKKFALWGALIGTVLMFTLYYTRAYTTGYPFVTNWWYASPGHSFFRLSCVIGVFSILYLLEKFFKENRIGDFMRLCGQE